MIKHTLVNISPCYHYRIKTVLHVSHEVSEHVQWCSYPASQFKGALSLSRRLTPFPKGPVMFVEPAASWSAVFMNHCRYHFYFTLTFAFAVHTLQSQAWIMHSLFMALVFKTGALIQTRARGRKPSESSLCSLSCRPTSVSQDCIIRDDSFMCSVTFPTELNVQLGSICTVKQCLFFFTHYYTRMDLKWNNH